MEAMLRITAMLPLDVLWDGLEEDFAEGLLCAMVVCVLMGGMGWVLSSVCTSGMKR